MRPQTFSCSQQNQVPLPSTRWEDVWKKCQGIHFSLDLFGWNCRALTLQVKEVINKDSANGQAWPCSPNWPRVVSPQMLLSTRVLPRPRLHERKLRSFPDSRGAESKVSTLKDSKGRRDPREREWQRSLLGDLRGVASGKPVPSRCV